jgi:hypothetical protein
MPNRNAQCCSADSSKWYTIGIVDNVLRTAFRTPTRLSPLQILGNEKCPSHDNIFVHESSSLFHWILCSLATEWQLVFSCDFAVSLLVAMK